MLNYHIIPAFTTQRTQAHYHHYLSLGSYKSPFKLDPLLSFSRICIYKNTKFPKLKPTSNNIIIPLTGSIKIDSSKTDKPVLNPIDIGSVQEEQQHQMEQFLFISFKDNSVIKVQDQHCIAKGQLIKIDKIFIEKDKDYQIEENTFVYLNKGSIQITAQNWKVNQHQAIYISNGSIKIHPLQETEIYNIKIVKE